GSRLRHSAEGDLTHIAGWGSTAGPRVGDNRGPFRGRISNLPGLAETGESVLPLTSQVGWSCTGFCVRQHIVSQLDILSEQKRRSRNGDGQLHGGPRVTLIPRAPWRAW